MTSANIEDMKARVKQAAGSLTDDDKLKRRGKRKGKRDHAAASVKKAVDKASDKIQAGVEAVKDRFDRN